MASLVTLANYKLAINETDASKDTYHQQALDDASYAILSYADRDFGTASAGPSNKTYIYRGSGILSIDDASVVTRVTFEGQSALPTTAWRARREGPASVTVFSYLELPRLDWGRTASLGAMGFTRNLDQFLLDGGTFGSTVVTVNGTWGWPTVPPDVQRATIWTAKHFENTTASAGEAGDLASKSVGEVAESYFGQMQNQQTGTEPLPARARALIDAYRRFSIPGG